MTSIRPFCLSLALLLTACTHLGNGGDGSQRAEPGETRPTPANSPAQTEDTAAEDESAAVVVAEPGWYRASDSYYREGVYEIPVGAGASVNFRFLLREGDSVVYYWGTSDGAPEQLRAVFHGQPEDAAAEPRIYREHIGGRESGSLTAPFTGRHGWRLTNTGDRPMTVLLRLAGFFSELEPQGGPQDP